MVVKHIDATVREVLAGRPGRSIPQVLNPCVDNDQAPPEQ